MRSITRFLISSCRISSPSRPPVQRSIHTSATAYRGLDLFAAYRRPAPSALVTPRDVTVMQRDGPRSDPVADPVKHTTGKSPMAQPGALAKQTSAANAIGHIQALLPEVVGESAGAKDQGMTVQGVYIPPKPRPPGDEDCCMSGCVHCVYTIYADDLETYTESITSARAGLRLAGVDESTWPSEVRQTAIHIKDEEVEKVEDGLDPTMAAFFALESRIKERQSKA